MGSMLEGPRNRVSLGLACLLTVKVYIAVC
jgi:hypothetical protein